jgi:spore maturation protein CgeB
LRTGLWQVKELPAEGLVSLYNRSKIGINMHLSFGPVNLRMYELPANGVMQICDCPQGLNDVFDVGKEVIGYSSMKEAIELIHYYLEHDNERKQIAQAGFRRVMKDYKKVTVLEGAMHKIKKGMIEDGITTFKDGSPINV